MGNCGNLDIFFDDVMAIMNILYVSNDNGILLLGVSLTSLFINNSDVENLRVFVVDDMISASNKRLLIECANQFGRYISFIEMPNIEKLIGIEPPKGKWPANVFCRLFTPTLFGLDSSVDKVLYLDIDTIIDRNISELWNVDLVNYACGAVLECMGNLHKKAIGLGRSIPYLNSGMLLVSVQKWKEHELELKCRTYLIDNQYSLEYPDECVLNGVLNGAFKILPPEYNLTTLKCAFDYRELKMYRKSNVMYKEDEYCNAKNRPVIIHFTNSFMVDRPWMIDSNMLHPFSKLWMSYKEKSLWKDKPLYRKKRGTRGMIESILHRLPRKIVILVMGFIFCYIKPLKYQIRS